MTQSFRFLIFNTDYPEFLLGLYANHPGLEQAPYEEQMQVRVESLFGVADFYSRNLRELGHEAYDIHANNEFMQQTWAREHDIVVDGSTTLPPWWCQTYQKAKRIAAKTPLRYLKPLVRSMLRSSAGQPVWFYDILSAQIKNYRPDVLLNQDIGAIGTEFLKEMKPYVGLLVGQIASPLPPGEKFSCYDLVISSLPNFVDYFRKAGVPSELHRLGFEPAVLNKLDASGKRFPVSFVGSLSADHDGRIRLLEHLCRRFEIEIRGQGIESLPKDSPILRHYKGQAWGMEMYRILRNSKITLNHHIGIANDYANNMRLFEATGVGALLVTDEKVNLNEMFEPGKEVIAYRTPEECAEMIAYYLEHETERRIIARAGQQKTLRDHTYYQRMQELVEIIGRYVSGREKARIFS
jgi:spore maturation protein CgeB